MTPRTGQGVTERIAASVAWELGLCWLPVSSTVASSQRIRTRRKGDKKPTTWCGRQNAPPLKFASKQSDAAFSTFFSRWLSTRSSYWRYTRCGCTVGRYDALVKLSECRSYRSWDKRAAHFVMDDDERRTMPADACHHIGHNAILAFCLKIQLQTDEWDIQ